MVGPLTVSLRIQFKTLKLTMACSLKSKIQEFGTHIAQRQLPFSYRHSHQSIRHQPMDEFFLLVYFYFHTTVSALHRFPLACLQFHFYTQICQCITYLCAVLISHKMQDMHLIVKMHLKVYTIHSKPTLQVLYWNGFCLHIMVESRLSVLLSVTVEVISQ